MSNQVTDPASNAISRDLATVPWVETYPVHATAIKRSFTISAIGPVVLPAGL